MKRGTCKNCGFYLTELTLEHEGTFIPIPLAENAQMCIIRNVIKKPAQGCFRYYKERAPGVPAEKRLEFHEKHKNRFYASLAFGTSLVALIVSLIALFLG